MLAASTVSLAAAFSTAAPFKNCRVNLHITETLMFTCQITCFAAAASSCLHIHQQIKSGCVLVQVSFTVTWDIFDSFTFVIRQEQT